MNSLPDVVVLDTCVLISNVLRRMLLRLATEGCFRVAWSSVIGDEWCRNAAPAMPFSRQTSHAATAIIK